MMRFQNRALLLASLFFSASTAWPAEPVPATHDAASLQALVDSAVKETLREFDGKKLLTNQIAVTLVDLRDPEHPLRAHHRGDVQIYPASVVKLFYLVAAHRWMEDGKLADTPELRRAMRDMIVESYNEATHYIIDLLTGTTSGPELPEKEIDEWFEKRNAVNRHFFSLGYEHQREQEAVVRRAVWPRDAVHQAPPAEPQHAHHRRDGAVARGNRHGPGRLGETLGGDAGADEARAFQEDRGGR